MKHLIGKIVAPEKLTWLTDENQALYLMSMGWDKLDNAIINGFIWSQYLSDHDYRRVYLADVENSKEAIIEQILIQLNSNENL